MKLLLISLIATITLCLQAPAFAYQEEGPFAEFDLGMVSGKVGTEESFPGNAPGASFRYISTSKQSTPLFFNLGAGYSLNLNNSINWQPELLYFQLNGLKASSQAFFNSENISNFSYNIRSSGYWLANTFHFDVFTGNLTPIQPYVRLLLGLSRNNFYDYQAEGVTGLPLNYQSETTNNFAYGGDLGLSYQLSSTQVFNFSINYLDLGKSESGNNEYGSYKLPVSNLSLAGLQFGYLVQF